MRVTVFGMGYVGCVTAACLARDGHDVLGIDVDSNKVDLINSSQSPIMEAGLDEMIGEGITSGRLRASPKAQDLRDISLVCVGTPSNDNGSLDLRQLLRVCDDIALLLKHTDRYHVVNIRSTVVPGTVESLIIPLLEKKSHRKV